MMLAMKIGSAKACWIGIAVSMLFLARLPSADAAESVLVAQSTVTPAPAESVPVVQSTATPAPCVGNCHTVPPDVIAMTNLPMPRGGREQIVTYILSLPKVDLVISRVVTFPQELDIEFMTSGGTHATIHLPFSIPPPSSLFHFPQDATVDSVVINENIGGLPPIYTARILYHQGTDGRFNAYTVSQPRAHWPFITVP